MSFGVLGKTGRGAVEHFGLDVSVCVLCRASCYQNFNGEDAVLKLEVTCKFAFVCLACKFEYLLLPYMRTLFTILLVCWNQPNSLCTLYALSMKFFISPLSSQKMLTLSVPQ